MQPVNPDLSNELVKPDNRLPPPWSVGTLLRCPDCMLEHQYQGEI